MSEKPVRLSVVIPLAPGEQEGGELAESLAMGAPDAEILFASAEDPPPGWDPPAAARWVRCPDAGRAQQMNLGAEVSEGGHLWFLHADSRIDDETCSLLREAIRSYPEALHYFRLRFFDGGRIMRMNEWGADLRSRWFGAPFGDQGFCLSRELFVRLGGYDEACSYGEDHLLARRARKDGVQLNRIDYPIRTSARRYASEGWLRLVLSYQRKWIAQAIRDR